MQIQKIYFLLVLIIVPLLAGCGMKQLRMENEQLKLEVDNLKQVERDYSDRLQRLENLSAKEKAQMREEMETMRNDFNQRLVQKDSANRVLVQKNKDLTVIEIGEAQLFGSAQADLTKQGAGILQKLSGVLNDYPGYQVRVEGHTDSVPIGENLKSTFASNWELSTARATNVIRYMIYGLKVAPERLSAVGYAHYRPIGDNNTEEGRAKNRRIRMVVFKSIEEQ
jgi:chemotaxis protein MotB